MYGTVVVPVPDMVANIFWLNFSTWVSREYLRLCNNIFAKTFFPSFHWSSLCEGEQDGARHQDGLDEAASRQVSGGGGEEAVLHALADGRPGGGEHEEGARSHPSP